MGHNMGMLHDFDDEHGGSGGACDGTGIMSYGSAPNVWSTCSKADFLALYNDIIDSSSWNWCLEGKIDLVTCSSHQTPNPENMKYSLFVFPQKEFADFQRASNCLFLIKKPGIATFLILF